MNKDDQAAFDQVLRDLRRNRELLCRKERVIEGLQEMNSMLMTAYRAARDETLRIQESYRRVMAILSQHQGSVQPVNDPLEGPKDE